MLVDATGRAIGSKTDSVYTRVENENLEEIIAKINRGEHPFFDDQTGSKTVDDENLTFDPATLDEALESDAVAKDAHYVMTGKKRWRPKALAPNGKPWYNRPVGRLLKSIGYRVYSSIVTFLIALAVTHNVQLSTMVGGWDFVIKICTYWFFEMAWWGAVGRPE
jgi:uncharacterized membrane protein